MEILIAGSGSIGSVIGVLLDDIYKVKLLRKSAPFGNVPIEITGEVEISRDMEVISVSTSMSQVPDIIFITVQEQQTEQLCKQLLNSTFIGPSTILVSLQNGLQASEVILQYFPNNAIIVGTVWWSATLVTQQKILYHRKATTVLGIPQQSTATEDDLRQIEQALSVKFQIETTSDILTEMRKKLILNVVSPVLALVKRPYPEGMDLDPVRKMVHALFDEALETADLLDWGIDTSDDERLEQFHRILISGDIPDSKSRQIQHKVSTQLGIEKYGGRSSNVHELLDWMYLRGSRLADEIIQLVEQQETEYDPIDPIIFEQILSTTKSARCPS